MKKLFLLFLFTTIVFNTFAQQKVNTDSIPPHSPKKAILLSTVLPGAGQVYNKHWWKVPIIYAGLATSTYLVVNHNKIFRGYSDALEIRNAGGDDEYKNTIPTSSLKSLIDNRRNARDQAFLATIGIYGIQILDAYIQAHLFDFDVSDDIGFQYSPVILPNTSPDSNTPIVGLSLQINLR
jgi:hypothetical protein